MGKHSSKESEFNKITVGFICQRYRKNSSGKFVCIHQEFVAGDDVQYENAEGDAISPPEHDYQPFNMVLLSGHQIAEFIRNALNWFQMRGKFDLGMQTLETLLKKLD